MKDRNKFNTSIQGIRDNLDSLKEKFKILSEKIEILIDVLEELRIEKENEQFDK